MQAIPLGPSGPPVSIVGYGGMHLSLAERPPEEQALRVLHAVLDAGVTLIDTADAYCKDQSEVGHNERLIARALKERKSGRDQVIVATKGGIVRDGGGWHRNGRPAHIREACEASLRSLGVDRIDLYQLHAPDPEVPFLDSVGAFAQLQREGKIRWVGLSNVSVDQIREAERVVPILTVQNRLNPFFREALQDGVVAYTGERGIGFLAYSPTGGGRLTRKLPGHPALVGAAERHGATAHMVCLAWVRMQGPTVIPIPSARVVDHALDSVRSADLVLSRDELAAIDRAEFSRA
jgi:aryl-alcohol dehydrogenase-like predicted oxidoreductase